MIQNTLKEIGGIGIYGVVSVVLFVTVFGCAMVWAFCLRKPFLNSMGALPLAEDHNPNPGDTRHE